MNLGDGKARSPDKVAADPTGRGSVLSLVAEQIARTPEAIALIHDSRSVSYTHLGRRAAGRAAQLHHHGLTGGEIVGVRLHDPLERVVCVLSIWALGAAYLPLDPDDPPARLAAQLADAGTALLLTDAPLDAGRQAAVEGLAVLEIPAIPGMLNDSDLDTGITGPQDLAYLMYTSGSTGAPKAVAVEHGGVSGYLRAALASYLDLGASSVVLQLASFTFDPWLREVFAPLTTGGTVVLLRRHEQTDPERVLAAIRRYAVTDLLGVVPSMLLALARSPSFDAEPIALRSTMVSGESFQPVRRLGERLRPFGRLVNHYGQTECTLIATYHEVKPDDPRSVDLVGRPLPGVTIQLLDDDLAPVLPGTGGEVWIGSPNLARGYWGRPAETARAFRPDPSGEPGARRYRTGDYGRMLPDGALELLGRVDQQLKLRGQRIEPAEVESVLSLHPGVVQAAVGLARRSDDQLLVGYLVDRVGAVADDLELRSFLRARLPAYAVPSIFVRLDALPLRPSGKLDRSALPPPALDVSANHSNLPSAGMEQLVAEVWSEVLGLTDVPADADFFALGGHSLKAGEIAGRLRLLSGVELSVEQVLRNPTVRRLAAACADSHAPPMASITHQPELTEFPLSLPQQRVFAQQRLYQLSDNELSSGAYVVLIAYRLSGALDVAVARRALDRIVDRHQALRTAFDVTVPEPIAIVVTDDTTWWQTKDLMDLPAVERERRAGEIVRADGALPFDLSAGRLLRVRLLRLAEEEHVLSLACHHIASDGWSIGLLLRELSVLYNADLGGRPIPLTDLSIQYGDYALWQQQRLSAKLLADQLAYWRTQLQQLPVLELPSDRPRPATADRRGARVRLAIPRRMTRVVHSAGRAHGASLHMVVCAALATLLAGLCNETDIAFAIPVANRTPPEVEQLIGVFTNTLGIRVQLADDPCFDELLGRMRETVLAAYAHQDIPYERVVEALTSPSGRAERPMLQVLFALQNAPLEPPALDGIRVDSFNCARDTTKYDLVFSLTEDQGGLAGYLEYRQALFDPATADRIARALPATLSACLDEPTTPITTLLTGVDGVRPDPASSSR